MSSALMFSAFAHRLIRSHGLTEEARAALSRRATAIFNEASTAIRKARTVAQKSLNADIKNKIVSDREARQEQKEVRALAAS